MISTLASTDLFLIASAYLLGSISSAVLVARLLGLDDPRELGSRNPGATNMLRTGNLRAAALTLGGDIAKGYLPVLAASLLSASTLTLALTGLAAVIGHLLPVFFQFRGGKGVATALGACLGFSLALGGAQLLCWLSVFALLRISSVAAIVTALATPLLSYWLVPAFLWPCSLISGLLLLRHHHNLSDLFRGKEHRL